MPKALVKDVNLYYEVAGNGFPLVWCHELAQDHRGWDTQVKFFSRRYRVITYNARGYPPSDVPTDPNAYSQEQAVEDLYGLLRHLRVEQAYIGGLSMGGSVALAFGIAHPEMARALIVAGAGTGSTDPERFRRQVEEFARGLQERGMAAMVEYARGPTRTQLRQKNARGWEEFASSFASFSPTGCALTLKGFQAKRPTIFQMEASLRSQEVPTLILAGDEDDPCIEPSIFMKRCIPRCGLAVFPRTGHTINLEEPELFNRVVLDFLAAVEAGRWPKRDMGSGVGFLVPQSAGNNQGVQRSGRL